MRIAYLPGLFPMLSETPVLNQITGLVERGHEVEIFGDKPRVARAYHRSIDDHRLLDRAFYRPDMPEGLVTRWSLGFRLLRESDRATRQVLLRAMNFFQYGPRSATGRLAIQAAQFLPPRKFDIIQGGFGEQGLKALRMIRLGAIQGKLVTAFRGADLTKFLQRRGSRAYRPLFRRGDLFMPVSHHFAHRLRALGCPDDRIVVHRTGIDLTHFPYQPRIRPDSLRLVSVGRLVEKKGLQHALEAIALLQQSGVTVSYTIVGDGPLRQHLEALAGRRQLSHVHFTGALPQELVLDRLRDADLLLAPSVKAANGDEEGIPNVLKEAMAAGRLVVSTRHSGIPELVEHGVSGMLADEGDAPGLADAIRHLADHPEIWPGMLEAARRKVEQEYDIARLNDRLVQRYAELLGPGSGQPGW